MGKKQRLDFLETEFEKRIKEVDKLIYSLEKHIYRLRQDELLRKNKDFDKFNSISAIPDERIVKGTFISNEKMRWITKEIDKWTPEDYFFVFFTGPMEGHPLKIRPSTTVRYVSNAQRVDVIQALRDLANNIEANKDWILPEEN